MDIIYQRVQVLHREHGPEGIFVEAEMDKVWAGRVKARLKGK